MVGWPRAKVFGSAWYLQWFPELFLGGAVVVGAIAYAAVRPHVPRSIVLPEPAGVLPAQGV